MLRLALLIISSAVLLSACSSPQTPTLGPDGQPLPQVYKIGSGQKAKIEFRMLDSINELRAAAFLPPVQLNSQLNAAAATHSQDMANQNRAWHWGSNGSSLIDRGAQAGYPGQMLGENISETYETELETLSAWMLQPDTRAVILDPKAVNIGFAWFQQKNGKIWWTLVTGA